MELVVPNNTKTRFTVSEYLRISAASPTKLEYRDGEIIDMAGASFEHNQVAANLIRELGNCLKDTSCQALGSDQRSLAADHRYCYPDITVVCGEPRFDPADPSRMTLLNPQVLVEVLSPSTEATDRSEKLVRYINLPSMREYLLVAQDKPLVESYVRTTDGSWALGSKVTTLQGTVPLPSLGVSIAMTGIYANVVLPEPSPPTHGQAEDRTV